jgi:hypothetical protein
MHVDQRLRVTKKLLPGQPGTLKLARRYGDKLLCVRYRLDAQQRQRYTTVELVIDRGPASRRRDRIVWVKVRFEEAALQAQIRAQGAVWDRETKLWRMPYQAAAKLGLKARIVER